MVFVHTMLKDIQLKSGFKFSLVLFFLLLFKVSDAQFYNGLQMTFGKNRIQYNTFYWQYYRFDRYDVYFYSNGRELAQKLSQIVNDEIFNIENTLGYTINRRMLLVVYNRLSHFRQSNIGLVTGDDQYNTGGVTQIIDNKVFIYFEGDQEKFRTQIRAAVSRILLTEMLYGGNMRERLSSSTLLNLPEWYYEGLISYLAEGWSPELEERMRDAMQHDRFKHIGHLYGQDAIDAGHSIWYYISKVYGEHVIIDIIYLSKIYKNAESGFLAVLGLSMKEIQPDWKYYYTSRLIGENHPENVPEGKTLVKRPKKNMKYSQIRFSPDGKYVAYATNQMGKYKIWFQDLETGEKWRILRREHKLEQITDYSYPIIQWHPKGEILAFMIEEEGGIYLYFYNIKTGEMNTRPMLYFEKILDFDYSDTGLDLVLSAYTKAQSDIFLFNIVAGTNVQITNDEADDFNPRFIDKSNRIIFSSRRKQALAQSDSTQKNTDVFILNLKANPYTLTKLTDTPKTSEYDADEWAKNSYLFRSNDNGVYNLYQSAFDSTISYIDTTTHYRYFTNVKVISNYRNNLSGFTALGNKKLLAEVYLQKNKQYVYLKDMGSEPFQSYTLANTPMRESYLQEKLKMDTISDRDLWLSHELLKTLRSDTMTQEERAIDIDNYTFSNEVLSDVADSLANEKLSQRTDTFPDQRNYFTSFYTNYLVNQVDFGFLSASYQAYTGGAYYFNPGFNALFKIGANDLFEDYKLTGGVRFASDFDSNEYLFSVEDLKSRLDKQYIFHRQVMKSAGEYNITKIRSHELMYLVRYPFSQVSSVRATLSLRNDYNTILTFDQASLKEPDTYKSFAGIKLEYNFDNSISRGINIYEGMRTKAWFEFYKQLDGKHTDLFVIGGDIRHYQKIHRTLILANRLAFSKSFGSSRLLYYMGSTDNWINFSTTTPTFIDTSEIRINNKINWVYQAVATNMRGFSQNIRNGDAFFVLNSELRWPIVRYFANHPLNNDFFNNFQVVGFVDIGTAWTGWTPWDKENAYNTQIVNTPPVTVIVDKRRSPVVGGFGYGIRSRLFGYFVRLDWAYGVENNIILPRVFYLSLSLDF